MATRPKLSAEQLQEIAELKKLDESVLETEDEVIEFLAKNSSPSNVAFEERSKYRDEAYPLLYPLAKPIDLWYNKGLYGKVDPNYNSIIIQESWEVESLITQTIRNLPTDGDEEIFAMNFVVDAFRDLQSHMVSAANMGDVYSRGSVFVPLEAKGGWTSGANRYKQYLTAIYQGFAGAYLEQNQNYKNVTNFKEFMKTFSDFLHNTLPDFPISKSGFVLSKNFPPNSTGLMIEIATANYGDDAPKYTDFISDKNFTFYVGAAQKFGFRVDKNAPWRLVADIKSDVMQNYMKNYPAKPIEPLPVGEQPHNPCIVAANELFLQYVSRKIEFTQPDGNNCSLGKIQSIVCRTPDWSDASFLIHTYQPGSDEDLLDSYPPAEGTVRARWGSSLPSEGPATGQSHGLADDFTSHLRIMSLLDQQNKDIWINIPFQEEYCFNEDPGLGVGTCGPGTRIGNEWTNGLFAAAWAQEGSYPLLLDPMDSTGVDDYVWKIESAPNGETEVFREYQSTQQAFIHFLNDSQNAHPLPMMSDRADGRPNITSVGNDVGGRVRFLPTQIGEYVFSVEGFNLDIPGKPRSLGKKYLTAKVCKFIEAQTLDDGSYAVLGTERFFNLASQATMELLELFSVRKRVQNRARVTGGYNLGGAAGNLCTDNATGEEIPCLNYAKHEIPYISSEDIRNIRTGQHMVDDPTWDNFEQGWFLSFLQYLTGQHDIGQGTQGLNTLRSPRGINVYNGISSRFVHERREMTPGPERLTQGFRSGICQSMSVELQPPSRGSVPNFKRAYIARQPVWFDPWYDYRASELRSDGSGTTPPANCSVHENWIFVLALLANVLRDGISALECKTQGPTRVPGGASFGRAWGSLDVRSCDEVGLRNLVGAEGVEEAEEYFEQWFTTRQPNAQDHSPRSWIDYHRIGQGHESIYQILLNQNGLDVVDVTARRFVKTYHEVGQQATADNNVQRTFNDWYLRCDGIPMIPWDVSLNPEDPSPCNNGSPRHAKIITNLNTPGTDYFILREDDNLEFQNKRRQYLQTVQNYEPLLKGYNDRLQAKQLYDIQLASWNKVQSDETWLDFDNLFERQFQKTMELDISILKEYILNVYNSYVLSHEWLVTTKIKKSGTGTTRCMKKREPITMQQLEQIYPNVFWAKFYLSLRSKEMRKEISSVMLEHFQFQADTILASNSLDGLEQVLKIIEEKVKGVLEEKIGLTASSLYDTI